MRALPLVTALLGVAFLASASTNETIVVTADRGDYDGEENVLLLDGRAFVAYGTNCVFGSERVFLFLAGTNDVRRVLAEGGVSVTNGTRNGFCDRATFSRRSGEVVMHAFPDGRLARLSNGGADEVAGRRIRFWLDSEQVEVKGSDITLKDGAKGSEVMKMTGGR